MVIIPRTCVYPIIASATSAAFNSLREGVIGALDVAEQMNSVRHTLWGMQPGHVLLYATLFETCHENRHRLNETLVQQLLSLLYLPIHSPSFKLIY